MGRHPMMAPAIICPHGYKSPKIRPAMIRGNVFILSCVTFTSAYRYSPQHIAKAKIAVDTIPGSASGKMILYMTMNRLHPSIIAASSIS